ncbi:MAG: 6-O-methylguanine-DNA methyltransferase-like protein [Candidatus Moranbacteria bacterium GW2011_GWF2_37_11]|nr:MAG: 6-O-methylguanine-DNA methyltransferase-like protein [Candidatus Moranbacteria bacterium GW2011_GWF2_37_11]
MKKYHKIDEKKEKLAYRTLATFRSKVFDVVREIPKGKTLTYKQVAEKVGSPKAYRAVGNILNKNFDPEIPCHRVIRSDGKIGGYNRVEDKKREILEKERKTG